MAVASSCPLPWRCRFALAVQPAILERALANRSCASAEQAGNGAIQGKHLSEFHAIATEAFVGRRDFTLKLLGERATFSPVRLAESRLSRRYHVRGRIDCATGAPCAPKY